MGNRSKDKNAATSNPEQESRDATLARIIAEAVAQQTKSIVEAVSKQKSEETQALTDVFQRQMEETCVQYEELLKASRAQNFTSTLKVTSSTDGFRVMDPFDWTADKNIYQRWQLWSHKARLALDAMEGDNEKTKISYLHHWLDGKGIDKIKGWMNSKILITQAEYDALQERDRKGRYSSEKIESYFSLVENILTPRSNPLLAVEELHLAKQGSMTSQEFYSQILEIVKRCRFPNQAAEERAVRDAIFIGMNSQRAKVKAINFMNEEGKEVTVEFLLNHLAVEDGNSQHRFLSQLDSSTSVNMVTYDRRQNKGKSNRSRNSNGREREQNKSRGQTSSSTVQMSRKPPGMEGKCMRCGRPEHQQGEKCAARHAKCKDCHKIGHFYKVCQSSKKTARANLAQVTPQDVDDTPGMMNTCTFIPGSTTLSIPTHSRKTPQNFQQLEKESSNTVALPGFNHNADTTTYVETSRNAHNNVSVHDNRDTNHMAHRYRDTRKEVHLLSEPSELRPFEAMAHRDTRKEAHLLSRPSELQLTEDSETQRCNPAHVQQTRQEYSRLTETEKAKFQNPFIYNDDRNFVRHNSVNKISSNNVFMTTPNTSVSNSVFCRKKGRKRGICRDSRNSRRTCTCTYSRRTCTCTCTCSHTGDSP